VQIIVNGSAGILDIYTPYQPFYGEALYTLICHLPGLHLPVDKAYYYCGDLDVMPNGWPLQRMRSMRKEEAETRSRGRFSLWEEKEEEETNVVINNSRQDWGSFLNSLIYIIIIFFKYSIK
jgi:hypothetical protein